MHRMKHVVSGIPITLAAILLTACVSQGRRTASSALPQATHQAESAQATPPATQPVAAAVPATPAAKQLKGVKLYAIVESVDSSGLKLVVKDLAGRTRSLSVAPNAPITKGGDNGAIAFADVVPGNHVRLKVAGDTALSVHVSVLAKAPDQVAKAQ